MSRSRPREESEAWLAMAKRQGVAVKTELTSLYPEKYGEPFVVEGNGVRVAVRPVGGAADISSSF